MKRHGCEGWRGPAVIRSPSGDASVARCRRSRRRRRRCTPRTRRRSGTRSTKRNGSRPSAADVFPVFGERPVRRDRLRRRPEGALADLDDEAGNGATTEAAHQGRARLGEGVRFSHWRQPGRRRDEGPARTGARRGDASRRAAVRAGAGVHLTALREADAGDSTELAFEFLILTAPRTSEVLRARWEEIDRDAKVWTIPAAA